MARFESGKIYTGRIAHVTVGESKEKKTPQIVFTVEVEPDGDTRTVFRYLTEKTIDHVIKDLNALGYDRGGFDEIDPDHPNAFDFVGIPVKLRVRYETYDGKEREKWDFAFGGGGIEVQKMDSKGVSRLNAVFGAKLRAGLAKKAQQQPAPAKPAGGDASEETF